VAKLPDAPERPVPIFVEIDESQNQKFQRRKNQKSFSLGNWIVVGAFLLPILCVVLFVVYQAGIAQSFWTDLQGFWPQVVGPLQGLAVAVLGFIPYLLIWGPLSAGVWVDARKRRIEPSGWAACIFFVGVIGFPFYFATRPLKENEVREGGFMFNVLKGFVLVWTLTCVLGFGVFSMMTFVILRESPIPAALTFVQLAYGFTYTWILPMVGSALVGWFVRNPAIIERGPTGPLAASSNRPAR
jgi:hypothetical protein